MIGGLYVALILGCSDDLGRCQTVERIDGGWNSASACETEMFDLLEKSSGADYPTLTGKCVPAADSSRIARDPQSDFTPAG
jgi:hypothetical protein